MTPILYSENERAFDSNGIGVLSDLIDCTVESVLNGMYEFEMQYPVNGAYFSEIRRRSIIMAKPDPIADSQPFRVYRITKPMNGIVTVYARHLAYDMHGIVVSPFSSESVPSALQSLKTYASTECPFNFWTDKSTAASMNVAIPSSVWSLLGGSQGSILDVYGGEYEFDRFTVKLHNRRGSDRGVSIRYGKNLTSFEQDENCSACYTGVYPYWAGTDKLVQLREKIVNADGDFGYTRIMPLDLTQEWQNAPTEAQLRTRAMRYIKDNKIGIPDVSWKVEFIQLEQTEEYKGTSLLERVTLGDTVTINFEKMGVNAKARVSAVRYKPTLERYESVTLGKVKANIADTIVNQQQQIEKAPTRTDLEQAKIAATAWLTNGKGYKVERRDVNGNTVDTLYMDNPDINKAVNILRIGQSGIGFSHSGVAGPYVSAWTIDGVFNADFILAGALSANLIKTGVLTSTDGTVKVDLNSKKITIETKSSKTGLPGRIVLSSDGVEGFGYDNVNKRYVKSFRLEMGDRQDVSSTSLTSLTGAEGAGISLAGEAVFIRGNLGGLVDIDAATMKIGHKTISWKDNGNGTFSLIGR